MLTIETGPDVSGACLYDGPQYLAHFEDNKIADDVATTYNQIKQMRELCGMAAKKIRRRWLDKDMELLAEHLEAAHKGDGHE